MEISNYVPDSVYMSLLYILHTVINQAFLTCKHRKAWVRGLLLQLAAIATCSLADYSVTQQESCLGTRLARKYIFTSVYIVPVAVLIMQSGNTAQTSISRTHFHQSVHLVSAMTYHSIMSSMMQHLTIHLI